MKSFLWIALAVFAISFVFGGCVRNTSGQGNSPYAAVSDVGVYDSDMPKHVNISILMSLSRYHNEIKDYFQIFHDKMLAEHNIDIKISLDMMSSDNYMDVLTERIESGNTPDVFTLPAGWQLSHTLDKSEFMQLSDEAFADKIYPSIREIAARDEELYALPFETEAYGVLYNKDIFEQCGLTFPKTYEELVRVVNVLESSGYTAFELTMMEENEPSLLGELLIELAAGNIEGSEQQIGDSYKQDGHYANLSEIYRIIDFLYAHSRKDAGYRNETQGVIDYSKGSAAMWVSSTHIAKRVQLANPTMKIGFAALPVSDNKSSNRIKLEGITSLAVSAHTNEREAAMLLMDFILDDKESSAFFETLQLSPITESHNYDIPLWLNEIRDYVRTEQTRSKFCLPEAPKAEAGRVLKRYYLKKTDTEDLASYFERIFLED